MMVSANGGERGKSGLPQKVLICTSEVLEHFEEFYHNYLPGDVPSLDRIQILSLQDKDGFCAGHNTHGAGMDKFTVLECK